MNRFVLAAVLVGAAVGPAAGASPDPKDLAIPPAADARARELVRKLGSSVYVEREAAHAELARMGRLARPALLDGLVAAASPEVRSRCARLLPPADAADLQARVDTFLADADTRFEHDLPCWGRYRQLLGAGPAARQLYADLLKAGPNRDLLVALELPPAEAGRAIADRRLSVYLDLNPWATGRAVNGQVQQRQPSLVDVAVLVLGEVLVDGRSIPRAGPFNPVSVAMLMTQSQQAQQAMNGGGGPHAETYRRLVSWWLHTRAADDLRGHELLNVLGQFQGLPEALPLLRRAVTTDNMQQGMRMQAMSYLLQRQRDKEMPFIRSLIASDAEIGAARARLAADDPALAAVVGAAADLAGRSEADRRLRNLGEMAQPVWLGNPGRGQVPCQVRDFALGVVLADAKQDLRSYGFEMQPGAQQPPVITYPMFAFVDDPKGLTADQKRDAAIKKWREFEAARAAKEPPK